MGMGVGIPTQMKLLLFAWLLLSGPGLLGVFAQCNAELPSGKACGQDDFFVEADPEACSFFYDCSAGCVSHMQCEPHADGLPRVFDVNMEWCGLTQDVDCGSRPCKDPEMCATQPTRTTATTTEDCGHFFDCDAAGNGYFPDPFNCRKYWHCYGGGTHEHILCPDDPQTGKPVASSSKTEGPFPTTTSRRSPPSILFSVLGEVCRSSSRPSPERPLPLRSSPQTPSRT